MSNQLKSILNDPHHPSYYLIGEVAYNHEGDHAFCMKTIEELVRHPISAVKIHLLKDIGEYMTPSNRDYALRAAWLWSDKQYHQILDQISESGKDIIAMADCTQSIELLRERGDISGIELHAVCLNDPHMLQAISTFPATLFLGIGGTELDEITQAVEYLRAQGRNDIVLMYGIQTFPTELDKVNLLKMNALKEKLECEIGYADHTSWDHPQNTLVSTLAYTMGYRILEKHFTHAWGQERIDYQAAIGNAQLTELVDNLNTIQTCKGSGALILNDAEKEYGSLGPMKKVFVASRPLKKGDLLSWDSVSLKRAGEVGDLRQSESELILGRTLNRDVEQGAVIFKKDFNA